MKSLGREKDEEARKVWGERAEQEGLGKQLMLLEVELIWSAWNENERHIYRDAKGWSFMEGPTKQKENSIPKFNTKRIE